MRLVARCWAECLLIVIVCSSAAMSLAWVFTVPILQNPDEESHIDYAFTIYSANRLLNVRRPPSAWNLHSRVSDRFDWERVSHQYTLYLIDHTDFERVRFRADQKLPADYGTPTYYRNLDERAPQRPANLPDLGPRDNPWLVTGYPFGYYALVAGWLKLWSLSGGGPVSLFFGARILSVVLLVCSLALTYATLREWPLSKGRSLMLVAIAAFFPMTTFVSSSVQPDNLSWTLMSLCFYLALRLRRTGANGGLMALLGTALGLLLVTKYHFYLLTLIPILLGTVVSDSMLLRRSLSERLRSMTILLAPSLLLCGAQYWVTAGDRITGSNLRFTTAGLVGGLREAVRDYYWRGPAFLSWWGTFGWMDTPLVIRSSAVQGRLQVVLSAVTVALLVLTLLRLAQVLIHLAIVGSRREWATAWRIFLSNPLMNSYFLFTAFMIALYAVSANSFHAQGRHWFPYTVAGVLVATEYAPRAFSHRRTRTIVSALLTCALAIYCGVGSYYSFQVIKQRFYVASP